jgi:hypothetical protein
MPSITTIEPKCLPNGDLNKDPYPPSTTTT